MSQNEQMIKDAMKYAMSQLPGAEEILKIKAENESLRAQVVALQASEAKLMDEIDKLRDEASGEGGDDLVYENEKLKEEIDDLKYDMENDLYTEEDLTELKEGWGEVLQGEIDELKAKFNQK